MTLRRRIAYTLLWVYKHGPSQVFYVFGARCQHEPTCSQYGAECLARHGWWPGLWMLIARLMRCRPGGSSGWDPAPQAVPKAPFWAPWRYGDWATHYRVYPADRLEAENEASKKAQD